jgi:aromatic ring-opening dioxygenase catalytic subunit (LigB family)
VKGELKKEGVELKTNTKRGYDHGVFVPLIILYPKADVPVIQISILKSLNPEAHFRMGVALRGLKSQGFLIIGSGASVHGGFGQPESVQISKVFDGELTSLLTGPQSEDELLERVKNWKKVKYSRQMHPREEHLVPLFINAGASSGKAPRNMKVFLMGVHLSNYIFE